MASEELRAVKIAFKKESVQMPNDRSSDHQQICEEVLRNITLVTLPWLSLQRQLLEIVKEGTKDARYLRPIQNFALIELQALMMILDRSRTWRNRIDSDFEKRMEDAFNDVFLKFASASIHSLEAQELILTGLFGALDKFRKGNKTKNYSDRKAKAQSD